MLKRAEWPLRRPDVGRPVMGEVLRFIPPDINFDPETVAVLGAAFDKTIAALHDGRQPEIVRETIAKRIIALAAKGERNPNRLCETTLAAMGILRVDTGRVGRSAKIPIAKPHKT
jgi:hypothetical protein